MPQNRVTATSVAVDTRCVYQSKPDDYVGLYLLTCPCTWLWAKAQHQVCIITVLSICTVLNKSPSNHSWISWLPQRYYGNIHDYINKNVSCKGLWWVYYVYVCLPYVCVRWSITFAGSKQPRLWSAWSSPKLQAADRSHISAHHAHISSSNWIAACQRLIVYDHHLLHIYGILPLIA